MSSQPLHHASLIVEAGHRLRVTAVAECAALYFYHKARASGSAIDASVSALTDFGAFLLTAAAHHQLLSAACIFLAAKASECPVHLRDVVNVFFRMLQKRDLRLGATYQTLRESIANCELLLLRALSFNTIAPTPHKVYLHETSRPDE